MGVVTGETTHFAAALSKTAARLHGGIVLQQILLVSFFAFWRNFENGNGIEEPLPGAKVLIGFAGLQYPGVARLVTAHAYVFSQPWRQFRRVHNIPTTLGILRMRLAGSVAILAANR